MQNDETQHLFHLLLLSFPYDICPITNMNNTIASDSNQLSLASPWNKHGHSQVRNVYGYNSRHPALELFKVEAIYVNVGVMEFRSPARIGLLCLLSPAIFVFLNVLGSFFETVRLNLECPKFPAIAHDQSCR